MNILVTLDSNYVFPLTVLLKSIMITNINNTFDIYVAHCSLSEDDFCNIKKSVDPIRTKIHPIKISPEILEDAPVPKRITKETYYRLLMMDYLPENIDRILYIDPDTIVLRDLSPLYNIDFKGKTIAAAGHTKLFIEDINHLRFKTGKESRYFNAGVMMVNLEKMRKTVSGQMIFDYVKKHQRWLFLADQDVLNGMFGNDMIPIDECLYNLDEKTIIYNPHKVKGIQWIEENAVIIHYNGKYKPLKKGYRGKLAYLWFMFKDTQLPKMIIAS